MIDEISPRLRFSSFKNHWYKGKLSDICDTIMGNAFKSSDFTETGAQLIRMGNLYKGDLQLDRTPVFLPEAFINDYKKFELNADDLVMSMTGTIGKRDYGFVVQIPSILDKLLLNQRVMKIQSNEKSIKGFILYLLKTETLLNKLYSLPGGTKQANLSAGQFKDLAIFYPSHEEQQKIADFLSSVDKKISLLKEKHALLAQYKKGVMQKLFKQEIRFKDDNGNTFPDWEIKPLSKLAEKNSLKNKDNAVNAVLTNSAKSGIVNQGDYFNKDIANQGNLTGYTVVEKNDFIYNPRISELAPVGPIKRNHIGQGVMSPLYTTFRFKDKNVLDYLEQYFNTTMWHRYMNSIANFGARHDRMNITSADFYALPIPLPCEGEREKIVSFIKALETKVNAVNEQVELTQTFKKGLLQQMFV